MNRLPRAAHFIRKNTQLRSSFIRNQIGAHEKYVPVLVWRINDARSKDAGYADFDSSNHPVLDLSEGRGWTEKALFAGPKMLSARQVDDVRKFLKAQDAQICHFHYGSDCGVFHPLLEVLDLPSVVSFYGYDAYSFPKRLLGFGKRYLRRRVFDRVDAVLAMSPEMKEDLINAGCPQDKVVVHYHGVPSGLFDGIKSSYDQASSAFTLLITSYFDPVKGHIFIFQALKALIERGVVNIRLKIAGSGFYEGALQKFIQENDLAAYVTFLGVLKYGSEEMLREMANSDVFIHPSVVTKDDKEGIPGAIVEAMFAGLPVISTFHGGIPYIIENENTGLLVREWDVPALSAAILRLKNDRILRERLGRAGRKYALGRLALEEGEKRLELIYDSLR